MAGTTIRPLDTGDWDAWRALRLRALAEHPDAFGSDFDETVAAGEQVARDRFAPLHRDVRNQVFGAFDDAGILVGVAGLVGSDRRKMRHRMTIWGVYVVPLARGAGVARGLIDACITYAGTVPGVLQVHVTVTSHNRPAIALYERCGFTRYGRDPRALILPDGREIDEDLMVLLLNR